MKRSASSAFKPVSAGYRSAAPSSTRQDSDVAGDADVTGSTALEENQRVLDAGPGHTEPMPFPGPYAHDPARAVLAQFGPAYDVAVPAPTTTAAVTEASSTATTSVARANAPAGAAGPLATPAAPHDQPLPSDGKDLNPDGLPPLILAAERGNLDQLKTLIEQPGVDLNQVDARFGSTALMFAAQAGNPDVVEFLLAMNADVNYKNQKIGTTALIFASAAGKLEVVNVLLKRPGVRLEQTRNNGVCALVAAAQNGHADIVNALLDAGADVNYKNPKSGNTALILASADGKLEVVNVLLKRPGVRLGQTNNNGRYALACAAQNGHADIVNALLDAGADVNLVDPQTGTTALIFASAAGKLEVVDVLLKRPGIRLEQTSNNGVCALACAAMYGLADIVERLIEAGASVTSLDGAGQNCLRYAIANGHANVVECLLNRGATLHNPLVKSPANAVHAISLSDLYLLHRMPAASIDNPLCLLDARLLDDPGRFFQALVAALKPNADGNVNGALADWLAAQGIRQSIVTPMMTSLGDLSQVWSALAAPGQPGPFPQQKLLYCASTLSRLVVLIPDQQVASPYLQAKLSAAGVTSLSQLAIAQRNKLAALAEVVAARLASNMLHRLATECIAKTGVNLQVDARALKTSMVNTGCLAPLADMLVNSWRAAVGKLMGTPMPTPQPFSMADAMKIIHEPIATEGARLPQPSSMADAMKLIHEHIATEGARLFAQEILHQLDSQALLTQWRTTLGGTHAEGLFALFDDQCRQLRQYCEQMGEHGA